MALPRPIPLPLLEPIARQLQVLGQPARIRLIDRLGELSVGTIAADLGITSYNASQQLGVLRRVGFVSRRQRGREGIYALLDGRALEVYELGLGKLGGGARAAGPGPYRPAVASGLSTTSACLEAGAQQWPPAVRCAQPVERVGPGPNGRSS
jgi:DNA-binding transcriptional ArsR family regulator